MIRGLTDVEPRGMFSRKQKMFRRASLWAMKEESTFDCFNSTFIFKMKQKPQRWCKTSSETEHLWEFFKHQT